MKHLIAALCLLAFPAFGDPALIENVKATKTGGTWRFDVTILHPDTGWDHYADGWKIIAPDGKVLGERPLAHPHETEQPFTRSLTGVKISETIDHVFVQANCSVDGITAPQIRVGLN